ncbi:MAG: bifunctional (p)ppGpp synthetase/guanosine-3',5'-bis(diphosphate) 3'-pyrophosphohydrolase [Lewinellaceae bacterium]|nr:bifunctional (p)ppGpp synthetase/guanosine-3',5'-bis(diphosphate) 3'-pyrophosphohydrolase [Lewinellaceae bacterium]
MEQENMPLPEPDRDTALIQRAYRNLLKSMPTPLEKEDKQNIRAAFELAAKAHQKQRRKSGEPYILHPIEVARICVEEIGLGPTAVVCALLHDVVEDTEVTLKEIHAQFGERVALIVDGLTKLDSLHDSESPQAENLTKVLRTMLSDVRVVLIKMADRLHNLRTIKSMAEHKQIRIAAETNSIYAPLAHRLGLYKIKTEFQEICLKISHPAEYHDIAEKLAQTKRARELYIEEFKRPLQKALEEQLGAGVRIIGRPKSIHSIWTKIRTKLVAFEDIYDLFAIRIILDVPPEREKVACWQTYAIVTDFYTPVPERIKDWITNPKANGYESLHTSVMGPKGKYVEVQIRSERMDEIAERGFAAHWKYKGIRRVRNDTNMFDTWLNQVRETLENVGAANAVEVLINLQSDLFSDEVHVFTPTGEMKILPEGATALDFAFSIHSDVGCTCRVVKVNNRIERINYVLKNGDQIEVITDKHQHPTEAWMNYVITSKAKNRIRSALKEEKRQLAAMGREKLERKLQNLHKCPVEENADMLAKWFGYPNRLEFLSAIALEQVDLAGLKSFRAEGQRLVEIEGEKAPAPGRRAETGRRQPGCQTPQKPERQGRYFYPRRPRQLLRLFVRDLLQPRAGRPDFCLHRRQGRRQNTSYNLPECSFHAGQLRIPRTRSGMGGGRQSRLCSHHTRHRCGRRPRGYSKNYRPDFRTWDQHSILFHFRGRRLFRGAYFPCGVQYPPAEPGYTGAQGFQVCSECEPYGVSAETGMFRYHAGPTGLSALSSFDNKICTSTQSSDFSARIARQSHWFSQAINQSKANPFYCMNDAGCSC